jgi:hypothetical protein
LPLSCRVVVPPVAVVYRPLPLSCRPSKIIVESSGPLVAVVVPHVALTSAATFVAVANHLPPPAALLLRRRCLHCHAADNFIDMPPLPSSLHHRFCLLRRAAVAFIIASLLIVAPPVALLPLVVIMPPVEVVVHSVALLPLAAVAPRRCAARRRRVPPVAIVVPPIEVRSLHRRPAGSVFVLAPPLPSLSRKRCLPCGATAPFIVAPPLPSSSPTLIVAWLCLRRRAAAASLLIVAPPLPSLSHHRVTAAFIIADADCCMVLPLLSRCRCLSLNRRAIAPFIVVPLVLLSSLRHCCLP